MQFFQLYTVTNNFLFIILNIHIFISLITRGNIVNEKVNARSSLFVVICFLSPLTISDSVININITLLLNIICVDSIACGHN